MNGDDGLLLASFSAVLVLSLAMALAAQSVGNSTAQLNQTPANALSVFSESGLPQNATWSVTYGPLTNSSPAASILFTTAQGNFTFAVPAQNVSGTLYVPNVTSGSVAAGNATAILFSALESTSTTSSTSTTVPSTSTTTAGAAYPSNYTANSFALNSSYFGSLLQGGGLNMLNSSTAQNASPAQLGRLRAVNRTVAGEILGRFSNYTRSGRVRIRNATLSVPYGNITQQGAYAPAGSELEYLGYNSTLAVLSNYAVNVTRAAAPLSLVVDGQQISTQGVHLIPIAVVDGRVGTTNRTWYWLNVTMSDRLLRGNRAVHAYSIVLGNGTALVPYAQSNAGAVNETYSYRVNLPVSANVTFDVYGNANYTGLDPSGVIVPTNVVTYVAVNVINRQTSAVAANTQIMIPVNALTYQQYYASNAVNAEWFFAGGTVAKSWLEGNAFNGLQTANLYTSNRLIYWLVVPNSTFLPASMTSNAQVYLGWAGNVVTAANTLMDGISTGESPLLSSSYGALDNGANVFTQYGGGGGTWSRFTTIGGNWLTSNGFLQQTSNTGATNIGGPVAIIESANYLASGNYILESAFSYAGNAVARVGIIAVASPSNGDSYGYRFIGQQTSNGAGFLSFLNDFVAWVVSNTYQGSISTPYTMSITDAAGTWSGNLVSGYGIGGTSLTSLAATTYTTNNYNGVATGYVGISAAWYNGANTVANPVNVMWFRLRAYPPAGVMPTITFGSTSNALHATPNPYTLSNSTIYLGQISVANTVISNGRSGTTLYTGNWVWIPPASSNIVKGNTITASIPTSNNALSVTINELAANSIKITFNGVVYYANAIGTNTVYGTWTFNAFASDAGGDSGPSPALTNSLSVNPSQCTISLSANALSFATLPPGTSAWTNSLVTDTNSGSIPATLWVSGTNWAYGANTFLVGNTEWNPTSLGAFGGNALTGTAANTLIIVPSGGSNTIYFGVKVPAATPQGTYTQNIIVLNVC
jgi:hypothetical protein